MLSRPVSASSAELIGRHLKVIGQPVRVRLVETLDGLGEASVGELAVAIDVTVYDASQHLAILRSAGVVRRRKVGRQQLYQLVEATTVLSIYGQVERDLRAQARQAAGGGGS